MAVTVDGLSWTGPHDFRRRLQFQGELPAEAGFYAFTDCEQLRPGAVLYVGATLNLRSRVPKYDFSTLGGGARPPVIHTGMIQIRNWQQNPNNKIFVWWALFPALKKEKELVSALVPRFNDKL